MSAFAVECEVHRMLSLFCQVSHYWKGNCTLNFDVSDPNGPAAFRIPSFRRFAFLYLFLLQVFVCVGIEFCFWAALRRLGCAYSTVQVPWFPGHMLRIYTYMYVYTGCNRRNGPDFGRVFFMLNYTEKPKNPKTPISKVERFGR